MKIKKAEKGLDVIIEPTVYANGWQGVGVEPRLGGIQGTVVGTVTYNQRPHIVIAVTQWDFNGDRRLEAPVLNEAGELVGFAVKPTFVSSLADAQKMLSLAQSSHRQVVDDEDETVWTRIDPKRLHRLCTRLGECGLRFSIGVNGRSMTLNLTEASVTKLMDLMSEENLRSWEQRAQEAS